MIQSVVVLKMASLMCLSISSIFSMQLWLYIVVEANKLIWTDGNDEMMLLVVHYNDVHCQKMGSMYVVCFSLFC